MYYQKTAWFVWKNELTPFVQLSITGMQKHLPPKDDHDAHLLITRLRRNVLHFGAGGFSNLPPTPSVPPF